MNTVRAISFATMKSLGFPTNPHLPLIDCTEAIRPLDEVVNRILAIHATAAAAHGFSRQLALSWLKEQSATDSLTVDENAYLNSGYGDRQALADRVESAFALMWSTCLIAQIDYSFPCPDDFVFKLPNIKSRESAAQLRLLAQLRTKNEIVQAVDLVYCLHWAVRDAQLRRALLPGKVEPYVIVERRLALEWLIYDTPWDEIELDT